MTREHAHKRRVLMLGDYTHIMRLGIPSHAGLIPAAALANAVRII